MKYSACIHCTKNNSNSKECKSCVGKIYNEIYDADPNCVHNIEGCLSGEYIVLNVQGGSVIDIMRYYNESISCR